MRRVRVWLLMLAVACTDEPTGASTVTGAYTLRTINGAPPPFTVMTGSAAGTIILDEVINLYYGFTFATTRHVRSSANTPVETQSETGRYSLQGTSITLRVNETGRDRIAIGNGTVMTFIEQGVTMVFSK